MTTIDPAERAELAAVLTRLRAARLFLTRPDVAICRAHAHIPHSRFDIDPTAASRSLAAAKIPYRSVPELAGLDAAITTLADFLAKADRSSVAAA
ncbi:MAG TPA: hypothetical protein P5256_09675 [Beijerinckiaceae bacterium]|nr:hypothetical protein [Hyphomicrobiales bacterium]HRY03387.1 hypothetical protein [Beijerinckiaceae bacterium]